MITEDCSRLRKLLEGLTASEQNKELVNGLRERKQDLGPVRDQLRSAADGLQPLNARGVQYEKYPTADQNKAQDRLAKMRETLATAPKDITKGRDFTTLKNGLEKLASDMVEMAATSWKSYVVREQPAVDQAQLGQYRRSHAVAVREIEDLVTSTKRLARKPPLNEEDMSLLETKWERIRELVRSLPKASTEPAVNTFIDAANERGGAELDLLTPEVLQWLMEEGMLDKFRIITH